MYNTGQSILEFIEYLNVALMFAQMSILTIMNFITYWHAFWNGSLAIANGLLCLKQNKQNYWSTQKRQYDVNIWLSIPVELYSKQGKSNPEKKKPTQTVLWYLIMILRLKKNRNSPSKYQGKSPTDFDILMI